MYLGVIFDEHITWKTTFITSVQAKANAAQAFIKRNINYCPAHIKSNCYKTFVGAILEYAFPIWAPHFQTDMVQHTAARYAMSNYSWRNSVTTTV